MVPLQYGVNATELIVNATNLLQTADTPLVPNQCRLDLIRLICMSSFRECIPVSVYLTPAVIFLYKSIQKKILIFNLLRFYKVFKHKLKQIYTFLFLLVDFRLFFRH